MGKYVMSSRPLVEEHATGLFVPIPKSENKNKAVRILHE